MGHHPVLRALLVASLAACAGPRSQAPVDGGHARLSCTECHEGGLADRDLADVPPEACAGGECHDRDVPSETVIGTVRFEHRDHAGDGGVTMGCAGCHNHDSGEEPLTAGAETCGLCHAEDLSGAHGEDCRLCHTAPSHSGFTDQGLEVPHLGLPWIEGGCVRCHFQVAEPVRAVDVERCRACHLDVQAATTAGIGEDLHPLHVGSACNACHEADEHRIEAMSSAVDLACADCHTVEHDATVGAVEEACSACHQGVHASSQRLLLGLLPEDGASNPAHHFTEGLTCRSCHDEARRGEPAGPAPAASCVACHRTEYGIIGRWWSEGVTGRARLVENYLGRADRDLARMEAAAAPLEGARRLLGVVDGAAGAHNLTLTHQIFEAALDSVAVAYRAVGGTAPSAPQLGRRPRPGICSYCHYRLNEPGLTERMDDAFHRDVVGAR
jgi:hypothetical protein